MTLPSSIGAANGSTDRSLLREFCAGAAPDAFAALLERYYGLVQAAAERVLHDRESASDVAQEVFLRFAREAGRVRADAVGAWLHRAAVRCALNERRSQARRRERELSTMNESMPDNSPEPMPEHWAQALEHLDNAMDRLSDAERQCVIERFHQDQPLREIARNAAKSEDAVRMTIQRALEKMCRFLRCRGVAVSAAALASGLAAEMSRAAVGLTPSVATSLSARAVCAAKSAVPGAATALFTTAMMTKTTVATAAAVAFLLAAGGGYLASRPNKTSAHSEDPKPDTAARAISTESSAAEKAKTAAGIGLGVTEQIIARMEDLWKRRNAILQRVPNDQKAPPDPGVVAQMFSDIEALQQEARMVLAGLVASSMPEAVEITKKRDQEMAGFILSALFEHWGGIDPEAARTAASKLAGTQGAGLQRAVARGWAMANPRAALAAADKWHPNDRQAQSAFVTSVFEGWARTDAPGAVQAFAAMPPDDQLLAVRAFDDLKKQPTQFAAAAQGIANLEDEVLRGKIVNKITEDWAKYDGPAAAAWFDTIAWQNPHAGLEAAVEIAEEWIGSGHNAAAAADWIWPKLPKEVHRKFLSSVVARRWAATDRAAAEAWLNKIGIAPGDVQGWNQASH